MKKTKVSRFEFAIMQAANDPRLVNHEPYTEQEEIDKRKQNIKSQFDRIIKKGS